MKAFLPFIVLFLFSCANSGGSDSKADDNDSINGMTVKEWKKNYVDSMTKEITTEAIRKAVFDTGGLFLAPVKVTKAHLFKKEYSHYRDISLTYKNVSAKRIEAIRFSWYGVNSFGDPADMGTSLLEGFGGGFDDDPLGAGKARTSTWSILSRDGKKVVLAWPTEVAFSDGSKWKLK